MKIDAVREGGSARVTLEGRLDREWAEQLSDTLQDLLQDGVRTLSLDFAGVTYVSSEAAKVLTRWHQELALLRGDVRLTALSTAVREGFAVAGWDADLGMPERPGALSGGLRRSYWHSRTDFAACGHYELSACTPEGTLTCHLHGDPEQLTRAPFGSGDCRSVALTEDTFALGLGAIGGNYSDCRERLGELIAVAGCVAYFPSDGARMADYLVGAGETAPRAVVASGVSCQGGFTKLIRFNKQPDAEAIPLSELAAIGLDAAGGTMAGLVVAGETAGLSGARLRRSPAEAAAPVRFEVPAIRDWLAFAPERIHAMTTTVIAGVVARKPTGPVAAHLRPLDGSGELHGHFHAAVFSYHPLPQRTVDLTGLLQGLFANQQLRDVLHLVWDDRGDAGVGESLLVRGVGWVGPITQVA
ncbi:MAG TPA: STAS domain-containing protein [Gemmatimonadales bacterium]|nr:STAS domain-containing protein [Gemmatimonadales bacterium]